MGGWFRLAALPMMIGALLAHGIARAEEDPPPPTATLGVPSSPLPPDGDNTGPAPPGPLAPPASLGVPARPPTPGGDDNFGANPPGLPSVAPPPPLPKNWQPRQEKYAFGTQFGAALLTSKNGLPGYGLTWFPSGNVGNQPGKDLGLVRQELALFSPFWQEGPDAAIAFLGVRNSLFKTDAKLVNSDRDFPTNLWDINVGVSYSHSFAEGWTAGVNVNAGSPSDKPFSAANVLNAGIIAYLTTPGRANDHWVFAVIYSPTSDFAYPIPGVAYFYQPNEYFEMNIGIPFLMKWRPYEDVTLEAFYLPIRTLSAKASWEATPGIRAFASFNWYYESYFLAERANNGDRFFSFEKRLATGLSFDLPFNLALEVSGGYGFDRFYFQGRRYGDRNRDRVSVDPGVFGQLQIRLKF
ncbi:hypothetical protein [Zavarzinella formosa]|uniref:hypothetical protein n=1 Tax=Zavarzinella formosa TaxID=360055 RepID=UPI0002D9522A|nr:hypothetical protein [Zavarzinella formosa]